MRTRKEIESEILLADVNREILLDIRQIVANIMLSMPAPRTGVDTMMEFVMECKKIAEETVK